eukprot:scaffold85617_cov33-Tisochrysis_lutea.AAC.1
MQPPHTHISVVINHYLTALLSPLPPHPPSRQLPKALGALQLDDQAFPKPFSHDEPSEGTSCVAVEVWSEVYDGSRVAAEARSKVYDRPEPPAGRRLAPKAACPASSCRDCASEHLRRSHAQWRRRCAPPECGVRLWLGT